MKIYEEPNVEVVTFEVEDVITESGKPPMVGPCTVIPGA